MNITVFGGTGVMGAEITRQLLDKTDAEITVADSDKSSLETIREGTEPRIGTQEVDIYQDEWWTTLDGTDLAINAVGPYYRHGTRILDSCIEAGVNYIDICDDYDTTEELLKRRNKARSEGVTAVIGIGASPGLTNLIAQYGYNRLESTDTVRIYWAESATDPTGPAAVEHWMHIIWGEIPMYIDGSLVEKSGLSETETISFQEPLGELDTAYTGHPEPVTLSQALADINTVTIKGTIFPPSMMEIYDSLNKLGGGSPDSFKVTNDTELPFRELSIRMVRASPQFSPGYFEELQEEIHNKYDDCAAGFKIVIKGTDGGTDVLLSYDMLSHSVKRTTAIPAALCSQLLLDGTLTESGVFSPEELVDPDSFLTEFCNKTDVEIRETRQENIVQSL